MYNFGLPAQLKAYVDQVVWVGRTFLFDALNEKQPYRALLTGKRMLGVNRLFERSALRDVRRADTHNKANTFFSNVSS